MAAAACGPQHALCACPVPKRLEQRCTAGASCGHLNLSLYMLCSAQRVAQQVWQRHSSSSPRADGLQLSLAPLRLPLQLALALPPPLPLPRASYLATPLSRSQAVRVGSPSSLGGALPGDVLRKWLHALGPRPGWSQHIMPTHGALPPSNPAISLSCWVAHLESQLIVAAAGTANA